MTWLELFERLQVAIAALIGFSGIIITIRANARISEKARKDKRSQEKDALIATLHSELTTIRDIIYDNLEKLDKVEEIFLHPLHNEDTFLDACVRKLGLLRKQTISKVLRAYLAWREVPRRLILEYGESAKIRDDYILVTKERKERCKAVLQAAWAPVLQALDLRHSIRNRHHVSAAAHCDPARPKVFGWFVGQVMNVTQGQANPSWSTRRCSGVCKTSWREALLRCYRWA